MQFSLLLLFVCENVLVIIFGRWNGDSTHESEKLCKLRKGALTRN